MLKVSNLSNNSCLPNKIYFGPTKCFEFVSYSFWKRGFKFACFNVTFKTDRLDIDTNIRTNTNTSPIVYRKLSLSSLTMGCFSTSSPIPPDSHPHK